MANDNYEIIIDHILTNEKKFYRIAFYYAKERETALDIVQNAICKAIENEHQLRNPEAVKTWFYRILINESMSLLKKNKWMESYDEQEKLEPVYVETAFEKDDSVAQAVDKLPDKLRTVILLRFYEDLSLQEIAEVTGVNLSTVKTRLYTALGRLKTTMTEVG